jgi:hypothetical protein
MEKILIEDRKNRRAHIRNIISAAPFWVEEPQDVKASINQTATFICKADGDPKPNYAWYINGVPLEDSMFIMITYLILIH